MTNLNKNLAILFPGVSYNTDNPLLYYAEFKYYLIRIRNHKNQLR